MKGANHECPWRSRRAAGAIQRLNKALAFTPPKPKPLEIAYSISIGRGSFATKSMPSAAGSGALKLSVGGATWSLIARIEKMAPSPPAAPSRCPVADFVALTAIAKSRPNTLLIASISPRSPTGVEVACALR